MLQRNIVNIVNFIRTVEPRNPEYRLFQATKRQVELAEEYRLPSTFLFEYDALLEADYTDLLLSAMKKSAYLETGLWLEVVRPMAEMAGIPWRGEKKSIWDRKRLWDWSSNVGFLIGYTPEERERLIDVAFEKFRAVFGAYPSCVGSWLIDAHSMQYIAETYRPKAFCICREQWGTDGYNIWGGYYNGAYYPSKHNMLSPAQTAETQISVPVFRMLGSDPIYQYDAGMNKHFNPKEMQTVITLEAANIPGGRNPKWVKWFTEEIYSEGNFPFGYAQAGQENAFGWGRIREGYEMQCRHFFNEREQGRVELEFLSQTGAWFTDAFAMTPPSVYKADNDWKKEGRASYWFSCAHYRANVFLEDDTVWLRDITLFDECVKERYLDTPCDSKSCYYTNLPVLDGYRWSGNDIRAGLRLRMTGEDFRYQSVEQLPAENTLTLRFTSERGELMLKLDESGIHAHFPAEGGEWQMQYHQLCNTTLSVYPSGIAYCTDDHRYRLVGPKGCVEANSQGVRIAARQGESELHLYPAGGDVESAEKTGG